MSANTMVADSTPVWFVEHHDGEWHDGGHVGDGYIVEAYEGARALLSRVNPEALQMSEGVSGYPIYRI